MVIKARENAVGAWSFLIGVLLAIILALIKSYSTTVFFKYNQLFYISLFFIGLVIGFLNIQAREVNSFLIAGTVLVVVSKFGLEGVIDRLGGSLIGSQLGLIGQEIFGALLILFVPATIIVALKSVFSSSSI